MDKPLHDMSNEELWQLFPILLVEHEPAWAARYMEERQHIMQAAGDSLKRISHIGSTSVPGLIAKPTIDILLELSDDADTEQVKEKISSLGFLFSPQPDNPPPHMMFLKGYTPRGFVGQVFHLHVRYLGDWDELYFRDYLLVHPDTAAEYGKLKLSLLEEYRHNRDGYTQAKTEFIKAVSKRAKQEFAGRYTPV